MIHVRTAKTLDDVRDVRPFLKGETWEHARKFLAAAPTDPFADHLRWLEEDGRPVACVQAFLHRYPIGRALVGMCLPEYPFVPPDLRGRGYFKRLMAELFAWMRRAAYPLAYDHGRKGLYTGIGYAPSFHHSMVLMRAADGLAVRAPCRAERATAAEIEAHEDLWRRAHPLGRGMQCRDERWRPDPGTVWLVRGDEAIRGFVVGGSAEDAPLFTVTDAWVADLSAAAALLRAVAHQAREAGAEWLRIHCRRDGPLARMAVLAGGQLRWWAAQERDCTERGEDVDAFYLADLRLAIQQLLPELNARWRGFGDDAPSALRLVMDDEEVVLRLGLELAIAETAADAPCVLLPRKAMTQAILGYATPTELSLLHEGCRVSDEARTAADALFVAREPRLDHEATAFGGPRRWGLVP